MSVYHFPPNLKSKPTIIVWEVKDIAVFSWMSRHGKTENDKELQTIIHSKDNGTKLLLFIMKNDNEGTDHYYLGQIHYISHSETTCEGNNGEIEPIVNFQFKIEIPVRDDIYDYFVNRSK